MNSTPPAIDTRGLARSFGSVQAVRGLDLAVGRGEMFGLVGPDGVGKSTAIRLLCGILEPTGGSGRILGYDLTTQPEEVKARIGYLSQNFTLYGDLSVDENIQFFAEIHEVSDFKKRREELLDFTRLTTFRGRLAADLSGGMKKKLALACTLIHMPDLIFLDEPSTGVDPVSRGEFWNILSGIMARGVTILLTTPYLDEAERCSRIGLMHGGRIHFTGTPDEVRGAMPGKLFWIDCPSPLNAHRALRKKWPTTSLMLCGTRLSFWTISGTDEVSSVCRWLDDAGFGPSGFKPKVPSLEDVFVAMITSNSSGGLIK